MIRRTLLAPVTLTGRGLHSGHPVHVRINPADSGIAFRCDGSRVVATPDAVTGTRARTTLGAVDTVEHLMSAFAGVGITDAEVELSYPELPGLDGSAAGYVLRTQPLDEVEIALLRDEVVVEAPEGSVLVRPGSGVWTYTFAYGSVTQTFTCRLPDDYATSVAPARTVAIADRVPALVAQGFGQGLDTSSVVLIDADGYTNTPRFPDEPARHKLLDLVGDLYLAGIPVGLLDVTASFSGHTTNVRMAALLREVTVRTGSRPATPTRPD